MNKVIRPHKQSGYLGKVEYRPIVAEDGEPDWVMICQPGPKAKAEFIAIGKQGIAPKIAARLVSEHGEEYIRRKIEILVWEIDEKPGKIDDLAGWLYAAIRDDHEPPKKFVPKAERQRRAEVTRRKDREAADEQNRKELEASRERAEAEAVDAYWKGLSSVQRAALEVAQEDCIGRRSSYVKLRVSLVGKPIRGA